MVKPQNSKVSSKRKRDFSGPKTAGEKPKKFQKLHSGEAPQKGFKKAVKFDKDKPRKAKPEFKKDPESKREHRIASENIVEARREKRRTHYPLKKELLSLWIKMRRPDITKDDRSKLVTEALIKMKGKILEIVGCQESSRVLQTCVKYCSKDEKNAVFEEIRPQMIFLAQGNYSSFLVIKMLEHASKEQLASFIASLRGHVASLLRHSVGSNVVEKAYSMGTNKQKQSLLMELYSPELHLFKDLASINETRVIDIIPKLDLRKSSVLRYMSSKLQPILEKKLLKHSITHKAIAEYLTIADKSSAAGLIQKFTTENIVEIKSQKPDDAGQHSKKLKRDDSDLPQFSTILPPDLLEMIHTRDGSRIGILCVKHGSAKERKKIIKGMKGQVQKIARDRFGSMVLVSLLSTVDDTKIMSKMIIPEYEEILNEAVFDQYARRPLLQLLHPNCSRYFHPDDLSSLNSFIPSMCTKDSETDVNEEINDDMNLDVPEIAKKDPLVRRKELLIQNGFAEKLVKACFEKAEDLLRSNFGKDVIYEVITGGADGILHPHMDEKLEELYEKIAYLVAEPKSIFPKGVKVEVTKPTSQLKRRAGETKSAFLKRKQEAKKAEPMFFNERAEEDREVDHLLESFHSSRVIRKLILDCPAFAAKLWEIGLKGRCADWAEGHGSKVICAFLETSDMDVQKSAKEELQPLIDSGALKLPGKNE